MQVEVFERGHCGSHRFVSLWCGPVYSSLAKQYIVSRQCVLVGTFDCEAISRRVYQLYEVKDV